MSRNRGRGPSFGTTVYPSPSGNRGEGQIGITPFLRCVQCGMPNDSRKTGWSDSGEGFGAVTDITVTRAPGQNTGTVNTKDHPVIGGCRFCGSLRWRNQKVAPIPDDRNRPSSEWYRRRGRR